MKKFTALFTIITSLIVTRVTSNGQFYHLGSENEFEGWTLLKTISNVELLTECILECQNQEGCYVSSLDGTFCHLYSKETSKEIIKGPSYHKMIAIKVDDESQSIEKTIKPCHFTYVNNVNKEDKKPTIKNCWGICRYKTGLCSNCEKYGGSACCRYGFKINGPNDECYGTNSCQGFHCCIQASDQIHFKNDKYLITRKSLAFMDAQRFCEKINASIVSIESKEENEFIAENVRNLRNAKGYWLGYAKFKDDQWKWMDGSPVSYQNWCYHEPGNDQKVNQQQEVKGCAEGRITNTCQFCWRNTNCGDKKIVVCKYSKNV